MHRRQLRPRPGLRRRACGVGLASSRRGRADRSLARDRSPPLPRPPSECVLDTLLAARLLTPCASGPSSASLRTHWPASALLGAQMRWCGLAAEYQRLLWVEERHHLVVRGRSSRRVTGSHNTSDSSGRWSVAPAASRQLAAGSQPAGRGVTVRRRCVALRCVVLCWIADGGVRSSSSLRRTFGGPLFGGQ